MEVDFSKCRWYKAFQEIFFWFLLQSHQDILPSFIELFETVVDQLDTDMFRCAVLQVGSTLLPHGRAGYKQLFDLQSRRPSPSAASSCPQPEFLLAASVPVSSCTVPRRHGRTTHQPESAPYGGSGPDLPCHRRLSHGSSRTEELGGSELTTSGSATLFESEAALRDLSFMTRPLLRTSLVSGKAWIVKAICLLANIGRFFFSCISQTTCIFILNSGSMIFTRPFSI